jgi:hypothetical protein
LEALKYFPGIAALSFSLFIGTTAEVFPAAGNAINIGSLDINSQETGDGAGCFFFTVENGKEVYVFVERDGYGWIRINDGLEKLAPSSQFVMWPSKSGEKLDRLYRSDRSQVKLAIQVAAGCGEFDDNCAVTYDGTLSVTFKKNRSVMAVNGVCRD